MERLTVIFMRGQQPHYSYNQNLRIYSLDRLTIFHDEAEAIPLQQSIFHTESHGENASNPKGLSAIKLLTPQSSQE